MAFTFSWWPLAHSHDLVVETFGVSCILLSVVSMPQLSCSFLGNNGIITARKRSLRRLCFHRCLSVHRGVSVQGESPSRGVSVQRGGLCLGWASVWGGGLCHGAPLFVPLICSNVWVVRILLECVLVFTCVR